jgi:hypothetical protein
MAWLWLSGCLDDTSEKRECLMRVLNISEDTDAARLARKGLAQLPELDAEQPAVKYPDQPPHAPPVTPQPAQLWESTEHLEPDVVNQTSAAPPQPNHAQQNISGCSAFSTALLVILVIGICGWVAWLNIGTSSIASSLTEQSTLLNVSTVLGTSVDAVNEQLGNPISSDTVRAGSLRSIPAGGTANGYILRDDVIVEVFFDQRGISKGLSISFGEDIYSLDERGKLLSSLGFADNQRPDNTAPAAIYWDNLEGCKIQVTGSLHTRAVHLINISTIR